MSVTMTSAESPALREQVGRLTRQLETANLRLRRNLVERDKMQAILLSALQSLSVGALAIGRDGIIILANPAACRLLGCRVEQLAGRPATELPIGAAQREELLNTLSSLGGAQRRVTWTPANPAEPLPVELELTAVHALPPYDDHLAGVMLLEDRSELRRLERQAQLRSRLTGMGEIAINLAHEIRNPLGSIGLFAAALEQSLAEGEPELAQLARHIEQGVHSLEHLVANALEFAKPRRLALARVELGALLADALHYVAHPLAQKRITLEHAHDLQPEARIIGDGEQLRQVFLNLLLNAIQAMQEGGRLRVVLRGHPGGGWRVSIADDGVGIPPELLERVFDPFFTTRDKGSGIGLAVVHRILTAHGARIGVESRVAAGTTFHLDFPADVPEVLRAQANEVTR